MFPPPSAIGFPGDPEGNSSFSFDLNLDECLQMNVWSGPSLTFWDTARMLRTCGLNLNAEPDLQTLCRTGIFKTQMHRSTCTTVVCCHFLVFSFQSVEIWAFWVDSCSDNRYTHQGRAATAPRSAPGASVIFMWWWWLFFCLRKALGATLMSCGWNYMYKITQIRALATLLHRHISFRIANAIQKILDAQIPHSIFKSIRFEICHWWNMQYNYVSSKIWSVLQV